MVLFCLSRKSSAVANLVNSYLQITAQKFEDPAEGEEALRKKFEELNETIKDSFRGLEEDYR